MNILNYADSIPDFRQELNIQHQTCDTLAIFRGINIPLIF
jgi:hypothetical protein